MPMAQPRTNRQRAGLVAASRSSRGRQQQIRHLRHRRNDNDRLQPLLPSSAERSPQSAPSPARLPPKCRQTSSQQAFSRYTQASHRHGPGRKPVQGTPSLSSLPSNASTSAFNTAAPAAPRMVLCDNTTNFQSSRVHSRNRPTVAAIPCPRILSSRGCGRSTRCVELHRLLRSSRQMLPLATEKLTPRGQDLLPRSLLLQLDAHALRMAIFNRYAIAMRAHLRIQHAQRCRRSGGPAACRPPPAASPLRS